MAEQKYPATGGKRCPESICDCFIEWFPEDPLRLRPELYGDRHASYLAWMNNGRDGGIIARTPPKEGE